MMRLDRLPNQKKDEKVVLFLRRHWFSVIKIILAFLLITVIPGAVAVIFWNTISPFMQHAVWGPLLTLIACLYVLAVWLFAFLEFTDFYLDTWIVTNERIINIEQQGLFHRVASELHLASVQDVTSDVRGMLHTFFDYGHVYIQTAAERERFNFKDIEHPEQVKELIIRLSDADKLRHGTLPPPATPVQPTEKPPIN